MTSAAAFEPPPYPYERLGALKEVARRSAVGLVDCSIGTPCDPVPDIAVAAAADALPNASGYPTSIGSIELRAAAASWLGVLGADVSADDEVAACVGTKELVASLPQYLRLRRPERDTVLYPAISYPTYAMGARLGGCRSVAVPLDASWRLDLGAISEADAARALLLWVNEPGNPTASAPDPAWFAELAAWGRKHGVLVASDECYCAFAPEPATILASGSRGVLAVHSLSKRSNLAGARVGFYAGDADVVGYLSETRKHAGLIAASPMQAVAVAVLGDERHVATQRERYRQRRDLLLGCLGRAGLSHEGGPTPFYLWLRDAQGASGWEIAERLARHGLLVAPGDLYGAPGAAHVRLALVQPTERIATVAERIDEEDA